MSQTESIWAKVQLKSPPEKFYGFFRNHMGDLVHMFPDNFQSFQFLEGESFTTGSVMHWQYHLGSPAAAKIKMRLVDDVKKSIVYEIMDGDVLKYYKVFRAKLEAVNGGLNKVGGNFAKWTIEYQKANENVPSPENYMELAVKVSKGLDAYIFKN
ncbi:hypothetical protein IC582_013641 [Cucumis melo]|uniref:MLP-like protein 423 n=2 Tax=Cucumis melo TaxID=3656 RepID=A0A1S3C4M0_CUCME|nr:MLP-like protein 423 [Cucumis melo]KAA0056062.1 MLP-like protein 423 [Cucumis melo var. makuwa]TYK01518.1 MLP-like protein 423 [Cucumis melo var. makuwa]